MPRHELAAALMLILLLPLGRARAGQSLRCDAGAAFEDYSFVDALAKSQWSQCTWKSKGKWGVLVGQQYLNRFNLEDYSGKAGLIWNFRDKAALEVHTDFAPDAEILPRFSTTWILYKGLSRGMTFSPSYRYSSYRITDVHMFSLGGDWQQSSRLGLRLNGYGTTTKFKTGSKTRFTPGVLAALKLSVDKRIQFVPSYSYREESFQAGAPGRFESSTFKAHVGRLELIIRLKENLSFRTAWQYEGRIPANYVRQYEFGLTAWFR